MIRLTLLLIAGLFGAMLIFGTEDPLLQAEAIEKHVLPDTTQSATIQPVIEPAPEAVNEPKVLPVVQVALQAEAPVAEPAVVQTVVEVAKLETLDLTSIPTNSAVAAVLEKVTAPALAITPEQPAQTSPLLVVTGSRVNLRVGPSTTQPIVTQLGLGDRAELLASTDDGWAQIRHLRSGHTGYMSADFLAPANPG